MRMPGRLRHLLAPRLLVTMVMNASSQSEEQGRGKAGNGKANAEVEVEVKAFKFGDAGGIPNSALPVLIYQAVLPRAAGAEAMEAMFHRNGWVPAWRYGVYPFAHYHSTAHEVLGVYRGSARLKLGGDVGREFEVLAGDVIVLPAGTGHQCLKASEDFHVVGAYPPGQEADLLKGEKGERPATDERIAKVPVPESDPVQGRGGALTEEWEKVRS